ncbi:MAG: HIT family protein [Pseudomonadota bacterium]
MFTLDPILQRDTLVLGEFPLSLLLLMNDRNFPWFILVPRRAEISEIYQLTPDDQRQLIQESSHLAQQLAAAFQADKMNIAAIGNVVRQLHVHHIARYRHDPLWPAPVWGKLDPVPYTKKEIAELREKILPSLALGFVSRPSL